MYLTRNLGIFARLMGGISIVVILTIIVGTVGIVNIRSISNADNELYDGALIPVAAMGTIAKAYQRQRVNLRDVIMAQTADEVAKFEKRNAEAKLIIEQEKAIYEKTISDGEERKMYNTFVSDYNMSNELMEKIIELSKAGKKDDATKLKSADSSFAIAVNMEKDVDKIGEMNREHALQTIQKNRAMATRATVVMMSVLIIVTILAFAMGFLLSSGITGPIAKAVHFSNSLAAGDLTVRIELTQKDELGQLASSLNTAADDLEKMVSDIINGSNNLSQAVQEIAAGNENLSQRTSEQASSLEEVASTIEETTASIAQSASNAKKADSLSKNTRKLAEEGGQVVYNAVSAIHEINESSRKIEEITSVINDIAFQTNLLALNAAVEAARAGEQGRGFAVVAGEVRNLAQRSGNAAKEIGALIKTAMEKVDKGTELANKSGDALKEIIIAIKDMGNMIAEINAAAEEQKQGADQINVAVSELDAATQQNAGLVEETASAAEEMSNQAQELLSMTERFKISRKG